MTRLGDCKPGDVITLPGCPWIKRAVVRRVGVGMVAVTVYRRTRGYQDFTTADGKRVRFRRPPERETWTPNVDVSVVGFDWKVARRATARR